MNENLYTPLLLLGIEVIAIVTAMIFLHWRAEKSRKADDEKMAAFMRHSRIESEKTARIGHRMIAEAHKTSRENALFLRMVFERVDKRDEPGS